MEQSALLTDSRQINFYIIMGLSRKSSSSRNIAMQQQGARKYGCFHRLPRAKLQSNAWGMLGGRWADMSTEYRLIVSINNIVSYGVPKLWKISTTVTFFCPQGGHCGEDQLYLKRPWKSKSFAQSSICYFLFSGRREYQRLIVLNWAAGQIFRCSKVALTI